MFSVGMILDYYIVIINHACRPPDSTQQLLSTNKGCTAGVAYYQV